ncbi:MAG TPA: 23S rRNA (adenine(2503)-C(2))-methyltransferase RlmN [Candidatus Limnocylindrales bacterium]|nr:23S rRNA (adenine(2503)-C(2))-methyltransferase RlmN [Candidatus Limnocylindrales bacterium]
MTTGAAPRTSMGKPLMVLPPGGPRDPRPGIAGLAPEALAAWLAARGQPAYRARQVADWLWGRSVASFDEMRTLPAALRAALAADFRADTLVSTELRPADQGLTEKALHRLDDGRLVESVLMRYPGSAERRERATVCISSQAGCAVGCPFCATGELGFERDLSTAEIVDQVRSWQRRLAVEGKHVTNVVFMGMGEPLLNVEPVVEAAMAITDARRLGLGARHLTVSTSGVVPGIERLTALRPQWTLAVSLHAARSALRDVLVPLNRRWPAEEVVAAATAYAEATGRRVSYEYVMIDAINDTPADARALVALLRGRLAHVNLIPMNPVAHTPWRPSAPARLDTFAGQLRAGGLTVTVRRNRGVEIGAACGQLAAEQAGQPAPAAVARRRETLVRRSAAALREAAAESAAAVGAGERGVGAGER